MKKFAIVLATTSMVANALSADGKCRILALRGGGVHGSFEVGVLTALLEKMPSEELTYDYVGGVSIGALNASIFSLFEPGDEKSAIETMRSLYDGRDSKEFFKFRNWSYIKAFTENSLADNGSLKHIFADVLADKPFKRNLSVASVDLISG